MGTGLAVGVRECDALGPPGGARSVENKGGIIIACVGCMRRRFRSGQKPLQALPAGRAKVIICQLCDQQMSAGARVRVSLQCPVEEGAGCHQEDGVRLFKAIEGEEAPQRFDLAQSGVQVSLSFGSGTFVPVLVGGGSLLNFKPEGGDKIKKGLPLPSPRNPGET